MHDKRIIVIAIFVLCAGLSQSSCASLMSSPTIPEPTQQPTIESPTHTAEATISETYAPTEQASLVRLLDPKEGDDWGETFYKSDGIDLCRDGSESWAFDGREGETIQISALGERACKGPDPAAWQGCFDSVLRLYDPAGNLLVENDNTALSSDVLPESRSYIPQMVLPVTGRYQIEVTSNPTHPAICDYSLQVIREGPTRRCPPPMLTATPNTDLAALKVGQQFEVDVTSQGVYPPSNWSISLKNGTSDPLNIMVSYDGMIVDSTLRSPVVELSGFSFSWTQAHFSVRVLASGTEEITIWENGKTSGGGGVSCDNAFGGPGVSAVVEINVP